MAESQIANNSVLIEYFKKNLNTAKECQDRIGQRQAHANLGNAYLKLEDFDKALYHYREAGELNKDDLFLAQIYFIIGCIYHIKHDYKSAIYFHEKHLNFAQQFQDSKGQCQAYLLLSQLNDKINQYDKGKKFYNLYTSLKRVIKTDEIQSLAKNKLNKNLRAESISVTLPESHNSHSIRSRSALPTGLIDITKTSKSSFTPMLTKKPMRTLLRKQSSTADSTELDELVHRMQKTRLDDQRCEMKISMIDKNDLSERRTTNTQLDDILNTIDRLQKFRLDDQRTTFPRSVNRHHASINEKFFDQLSRCQDSRLDDQRAVLLPVRSLMIRPVSAAAGITTSTNISTDELTSKTLPNEEFLSLFNRLQARYHEQQTLFSLSTKRTRVNT
ncbi:hypothetical protein I4U23_013799 [Adineta vaga]|nr:hypothetical protein I4U23_013799 [Adineta vaga]